MNYYDLMNKSANKGNGSYETSTESKGLGISNDENIIIYNYMRLNQSKVALRMSRVARQLPAVKFSNHKHVAGHAGAVAVTPDGLMLIPRRDYEDCTTPAKVYQPIIAMKQRLLDAREIYAKNKLSKVMDVRSWNVTRISMVKDYSKFSLTFYQDGQWRRTSRHLHLIAPQEFFELKFHGDGENCVVQIFQQFEQQDGMQIYETNSMTRQMITEGQNPEKRFFAILGEIIGTGITLERAIRSVNLKNSNAIRKELERF